MQEREFLRASPGSLQGLDEDVGWWEQHSTGQVLVSTEKFGDVLAAPQLCGSGTEDNFFLLFPLAQG